ncbi:hypothetical protein HK102_006798, partial [Quaeritorhiza haematococci]
HYLALNLAIADFLFNVPHAADHIWSIRNGFVLNDMTSCRVVGFFTAYGLQSIQAWAMVIAAYTASLILFQYEIPAGRFAWRILLVGWGVPLIYVLIPIRLYGASADDLYCYFVGRETNLYFKAMGLFVGWFFTSTCYVAIIIKILSHASTYKRMSSFRQSLTATVTGNNTVSGSNTNSVNGSAPSTLKRPGAGASDLKKPTINTQTKQEKLFYKASATLFLTCAVYIFTWLGAATAALSFFTTGYVK